MSLVRGWRADADPRVLTATAVGTSTAAGGTVHLVRPVSARLLREGDRLTEADRRRLAARWHVANSVRLVGLAAVAGSLRHLEVTDDRAP